MCHQESQRGPTRIGQIGPKLGASTHRELESPRWVLAARRRPWTRRSETACAEKLLVDVSVVQLGCGTNAKIDGT